MRIQSERTSWTICSPSCRKEVRALSAHGAPIENRTSCEKSALLKILLRTSFLSIIYSCLPVFLSRFNTVRLAACLPVLLHNGWILQLLHHKTDLLLTGFPFIRKPTLFRIWTKILNFLLLSSFVIEQLWRKIIIQCDTFVLSCNHRFVM